MQSQSTTKLRENAYGHEQLLKTLEGKDDKGTDLRLGGAVKKKEVKLMNTISFSPQKMVRADYSNI